MTKKELELEGQFLFIRGATEAIDILIKTVREVIRTGVINETGGQGKCVNRLAKGIKRSANEIQYTRDKNGYTRCKTVQNKGVCNEYSKCLS